MEIINHTESFPQASLAYFWKAWPINSPSVRVKNPNISSVCCLKILFKCFMLILIRKVDFTEKIESKYIQLFLKLSKVGKKYTFHTAWRRKKHLAFLCTARNAWSIRFGMYVILIQQHIHDCAGWQSSPTISNKTTSLLLYSLSQTHIQVQWNYTLPPLFRLNSYFFLLSRSVSYNWFQYKETTRSVTYWF